jgi:processing peptidase subunit alpha
VTPLLCRGRRGFSNLPAPSFNAVKFVKEDVTNVMEELPEFNFYEMKDPVPNKYKGVAMDQCVLDAVPTVAPVAPKMAFSKLENGLKIASVDKQGLTATIGLYVYGGSRFETAGSFGAAGMVELMGFKSTAHLSNLRTVKTFEQLGATVAVKAGREAVSYKVEILKEYLPFAVPLLVGNVLFPRLLPWEVKEAAKQVAGAKAALEADVDAYVGELLASTAFTNNTVGLKPSVKSLDNFTADTIRSYMIDHFAPERMVLAGVNVDHGELSKWAMRSFAEYNAIPMKARPDTKPTYTGGYTFVEAAGPCTVAIGFEGVADSSPNKAALLVLESLLGSGTTSLLGKAGLAAEASATFYSDTGLFSIVGTCEPAKAADYCKTLSTVLKTAPAAADVTKAKAAAKVALALADSSTLVDDMGMSLLVGGTCGTVGDLQKAIDGVDDKAIVAAAKKMLGSKPAVVAHGDIYAVPHYAAMEALFK